MCNDVNWMCTKVCVALNSEIILLYNQERVHRSAIIMCELWSRQLPALVAYHRDPPTPATPQKTLLGMSVINRAEYKRIELGRQTHKLVERKEGTYQNYNSNLRT